MNVLRKRCDVPGCATEAEKESAELWRALEWFREMGWSLDWSLRGGFGGDRCPECVEVKS